MHSEEGCTALMQASRFGHAHVVEVLLHARAEPDWRTIPSAGASTALILACKGGFARTCERLLAARASVDLARADGTTGLMIASDYGHT